MSEVPVYVYGIVEAGSRRPGGEGIKGAPLRLIRSGNVAALVSDLSGEELSLGPEHVMVHARVLEDAIGRGTILPMRFGVVVHDEHEVQERLLERHADALQAQLHQFAGKVELNLRAIYEEDALLREVAESDERIVRLRQTLRERPADATYYDRIELGELVAEGIEVRRGADAEELINALAPLAAAVQVRDPAHERIALSASFLVASDQLAAFDQRMEQVARDRFGRMRFKCTGPLPPHSFVEIGGEG